MNSSPASMSEKSAMCCAAWPGCTARVSNPKRCSWLPPPGFFMSMRASKILRDVCRQLAGIVARAVDERRFAPAHELQAHEIHPGRIDHAAVVADAPLMVEDR